jgi:putative spermidine/putrescine transport system permease protein
VLLAPMVVPIVVVSVGFYLLLQRLNLTDTKTGLVLAETTIVIPLAFIICRASVQALDPVYERAARSLGSGRTRVLRRIVFPLIRPALLVTLLFTFLTVFDEVVIPIFVTAVNVVPLPKQLYNSVVFASDPTIAVVGVFSLVLGAVVLGLSILFGGARAAGGGAGALAALTNTPGEDSDQTST